MKSRRSMVVYSLFALLSVSALIACAPMLREDDATALRHVQEGLATTYNADGGSGPQKSIAKTQYCELESVLVAAKEKPAGIITCGRDGGAGQ